MKLLSNISLAVITGALIAGCSNPVYVEKDESANLAKYKTYMWVDTRAREDDNSSATAFAKSQVHNAVNDELSKRGWREVTSNPDVLLSYDMLVEKSTEQRTDPVYSQPFTRYYYNPYARRWGAIYYPSQFLGYDEYNAPVREGTLTINLIDANSDKTIWQGWTTDQIDSRKFTGKDIARDVKHIFKKFDSAS